jgi:hypothetical protein
LKDVESSSLGLLYTHADDRAGQGDAYLIMSDINYYMKNKSAGFFFGKRNKFSNIIDASRIGKKIIITIRQLTGIICNYYAAHFLKYFI